MIISGGCNQLRGKLEEEMMRKDLLVNEPVPNGSIRKRNRERPKRSSTV